MDGGISAQFFYRSHDLSTKVISIPLDQLNVARLYSEISEKEAIPRDYFYLLKDGKPFDSVDICGQSKPICLDMRLSLPGGKGGFRSMLRAIGAQIEKTTNRGACRDLSGRRLRDINAEKRFQEWLDRKAKAKEERKKRRKEQLDKLKEEPKCVFQDEQYFKNREEIPEMIDDAMEQGLKLAKENQKCSPQAQTPSTSKSEVSETLKRKLETDTKDPKKSKNDRNLWLGIDLDDELGDNEDTENINE